MNEDAAGLRYAVTLTANVVRAPVSFLASLIVARTLGAGAYGDLTFLLASVVAISQLLEMGSSSAFYTFLARRNRRPAFFVLYGTWLLVQFVLPLVVIFAASPRLMTTVWQGQGRTLILLSWLSSFLSNQLWSATSQLGEAVRRTRTVQTASVLQALAHVAAVSVLAWMGWLTIQTFLWLTAIEYGLLFAVLAPPLAVGNLELGNAAESVGEMLRAFASYCRPLVIYGWVSFIFMFADRWLLQYFGGAPQQGFFAVGQQFATVSLLATTSAMKVFWKEIAHAQERADKARLQQLYDTVTRSLYAISAWISCLLIPYTREIITRSLGAEYSAAWASLAVMFFYPIHQSLGQIQGTFFYATGDTARYSRLGLIWMAISIPIAFVLLASPSQFRFGLGLGALGLALKLVFVQFLAVNVQNYVIARSQGWPYRVAYQAQVLGGFLLLAMIGKFAASFFLPRSLAVAFPATEPFVGCAIYTVLSAAIVRTILIRRGTFPLADAIRWGAELVGNGNRRTPTGPNVVGKR
jgi:O-antigen/teichoic acid export membrane protein